MIVKTLQGQTVLASCPDAEAVHVLGKLHGWCMWATPMHRRAEDGLWEATLREGISTHRLAFLVRRPGEAQGRIYRRDFIPPLPTLQNLGTDRHEDRPGCEAQQTPRLLVGSVAH